MALTKAHNRMIVGSVVNVKDYGATGDGVTDDAQAIQEAIDSIGSSGGSIFFPDGTYLVNTQIDLKTRLTIFGEERNNTKIKAGAAITSVLSLTGTAFNVRIKHLGIDGNSLAVKSVSIVGTLTSMAHFYMEDVICSGATTTQLELEHIIYARLQNVYATGGINAITLTSILTSKFEQCVFYDATSACVHISRGSGLYFDGCTVYNDNSRTPDELLLLDGAQQCTFLKCNFEPQGAGNVTNSVTLSDTVAGNCVDNHFIECQFIGVSTTQTHCIEISKAGSVYKTFISDCTFIKPTSTSSILISNGAETQIRGSVDLVTYDTPTWADVSVTNSSGNPYYQMARTGRFNNMAPMTDNSISNGSGSLRWTTIFATTGTINTSDETQKQNIRDISVAEKSVAYALKSQMKAFRFIDAFAEKGENARIHFGVIAQNVAAAFRAEGLDPNHYGVFCSDTWVDDDGTEQTRLGVRYEELFAFIISTL